MKGKSTTGGATAEFGPNMLGSARLRAGYAINSMFGQDLGHIMPYVTGGLGFGHFTAKFKNDAYEWTGKRLDTGYTIGGGVDYAINKNTIAKLEYQYMDFGKRTFSNESDYANLRLKAHTIRAGVAYKF
jgi:outer membrane immunogenic protein